MYINNKNAKRLGIYFFYDKNGIVDKYVPCFLEDIGQNVSEIFIVCNGKLNEEGKNILKQYGEVFVRKNEGLDVWAYKSSLDKFGWDKLEQYDEIILMNSTIMGPVYPFRETFEKMSERDLDFWGLTKYFKIEGDPFGCSPYGYLPDHIQSHFIVCRKSLVKSEAFHKYWDEMPMITNYSEAIGKHEVVFTKFFSDKGFKWDASVDTEDLREYSGYPLMMCPKKLIKEKRCPIFKRRSFFHNVDDFLRNTTGEQTSELYEYLRSDTNYDVDLIWETILRNYHQSDIVKNLNLVYVLSTEQADLEQMKMRLLTYKVALVMHVYFEDLLEEDYHYISSMPKETDIYITTHSQQLKNAIERKFVDLPCNKLEVRIIENRGRDVSSLLVGVKDVLLDYDLVCFVHDKKTAQVSPGTVGASFAYKCFENTLSNKKYVANIVNTFIDNPKLGLLTPPEPNHSAFFPTIGCEWGPNYDVTVELAETLGLKVPMSIEKQPIAPFGTMFWFRPKAMEPLLNKNWEYEDFPEEPNGIDGTLLHAIERIYPFVVQDAGYYPAIGMTDKFGAIEYNNLRHYVRGYNQILLNNGIGPYQDEMCVRMGEHFYNQGTSLSVMKWQIKNRLKRVLPSKVCKVLGKIKRAMK